MVKRCKIVNTHIDWSYAEITIRCEICDRTFSGKNIKLIEKLAKYHKEREHKMVCGPEEDGYDNVYTQTTQIGMQRMKIQRNDLNGDWEKNGKLCDHQANQQ